MANSTEEIPVVFVSYSHDSEDHKDWTRSLSERLIAESIDVKLDQWDVGLGDDLAQFMKQIRDCDRVLVICTESYVVKANSDKGGVGFEQLVITSELVTDLGTKKFIPIVRQYNSSSEPVRPIILETRLFIDMSQDEHFESNFAKVVEEIKGEKIHQKPALPSRSKTVDSVATQHNQSFFEGLSDSLDIFSTALEYAQSDNILNWRKLQNTLINRSNDGVQEWKAKYNNSPPSDKAQLRDQSIEGMNIYANIYVLTLAGIASKNNHYNKQISLINHIVNLGRQFQGTANSIRLKQYEVDVFVYQNLHSAFSMFTRQPELAIILAETKITVEEHIPSRMLCQTLPLVALPRNIADTTSEAWEFVNNIHIHFPWIAEIFGSNEDYQISLVSYHYLLNIHEFCQYVKNADNRGKYNHLALEIPVAFLYTADSIKQSAYVQLLENRDFLIQLFKSTGLEREDLNTEWSNWVQACTGYTQHYGSGFGWAEMTHQDVLSALSLN